MQAKPQEVGADKATTSTKPVTLHMLQERLATIRRCHEDAGECSEIALTADINGRHLILDIDNFQVSDDGCFEFVFTFSQAVRDMLAERQRQITTEGGEV